jgi:hypothetical protein
MYREKKESLREQVEQLRRSEEENGEENKVLNENRISSNEN